jgi:hypothetical protein
MRNNKMKKLTLALLLATASWGQDANQPNFSTVPGSGTVRWESNETLDTAATRACSSSTVVVTRTSGTVLSVGNGASSAAIQFVRLNPKTRSVTGAQTLTLSSGTGTGYVLIFGQLTSAGALQLVAYNVSSNVLAWGVGSLGTVVTNSPAALPSAPVVLLYKWTMTTGSWDTSGGTDTQPTVDCWIDRIEVSNNTGSAVTLTFTDNQGTALHLFDGNSIPANTTVSYVSPGGRYFDGGLQMNAGTANAMDINIRGVRLRQTVAGLVNINQ